jgi:hypothetical protein
VGGGFDLLVIRDIVKLLQDVLAAGESRGIFMVLSFFMRRGQSGQNLYRLCRGDFCSSVFFYQYVYGLTPL